MDKVQILLYAIASFFSTENPPILTKSANIEINLSTKQVVLHQYDIITIPQFSEKAGSALEELMKSQTFVNDLEPLLFTSKHFYEEGGKLNATIHFQFKEMRDLRAISMYFNAEENTLSYPFMEEFEYIAPNAVFDDRYVRFKSAHTINFSMSMKESPELKKTISLLSEWKKIQANKFVDISDTFSKKDFIKLREFVFKNGDFRTFRNFDNNNPHYSFEDFDVYLATGDQRSVFESDTLKPNDYTDLIIGLPEEFALYLSPDREFHQENEDEEETKVYTYASEKMDVLKERLATIKRVMN